MNAPTGRAPGRKRTVFAVSAAVFLAACGRPGSGVSVPAERLAIAPGDVRRHVQELAGDRYEGRGAGYAGEDRAAAYIEAQFRTIGLHPAGDVSASGRSYRQEFQFQPRGPELPGQVLTSRNVVGFLQGDDRTLRHEIVVLGAHHDGQGLADQADADRYPAADGSTDDTIWNSADDNASSVAVLIEVARSIVRDRVPHRRSIVFVTFGAEEHALNGSVRYVSDPPYPLERHVVMVNLEKLGRVPDQEIVAAATGTCLCWNEILAKADLETGRRVRSAITEVVPDTDHYPFDAERIPAIVLGALHEEDTHQPGDSADKIAYEALAARADFVRAVTLELLNRRDTPRFTGRQGRDLGLIPVVASAPEDRLLGLPDGAGALKVSSVIPGLPASRAGLSPGDFIVKLRGRPLKAAADKDAVQKAVDDAPGPIELSVLRHGRLEVVSIPAAQPGRG
jgi:peptidase M28-like protein/PDZ domain-containing protein